MTDRGPRAVRVVKFGGSTMGAAERIAAAAHRVIEADPRPAAVVVSAPGDLTDSILAWSSGIGGSSRAEEVARALSFGEALGASLLASALTALGVPVRLVLPGDPDWPIVTTGDPMASEIDLGLSAPRVAALFPPGAPLRVLPGFVGRSAATGGITTLGRGGSDTTAVALGRLLALRYGSSEVILVKDVPGVLEADPRLVPEARPLHELTVEEMRTLAVGGAEVVAASALAYMAPTVLLRVLSIGHPLDGSDGTVIRSSPAGSEATTPGRAAEEPPAPGGPGWGVVTVLPRTPASGRPRDGPAPETVPTPLRVWVRPEDAGRLLQELHGSGALRASAYREPPRSARRAATEKEGAADEGGP